MGPVLIELSPNRMLLDSNFDGYKLSLQDIPTKRRELTKPVDRVLLNSSQYSLLHTKLYGLHNHIIGDHLDDSDTVYFVDNDWNVCKIYLDPFNGDLIEPVIVWKIPRTGDRKTGDYNVTLKFADKNTAVLADGTGIMHILNTGSRNDDDRFVLQFSDEVIGRDEGFVIVDAVSKITQGKEDLHVLLLNIKQSNVNERFATFLYWVSFLKEGNSWQQIALRELNTKGGVQYVALEKNCNALYVVSDNGCKFTINSDCPVNELAPSDIPKTYKWSQNDEEIVIKFPISESIKKELVNISCKPTEIEIKYNGNTLVNGPLHQLIDSDLTTWTIIENNSYLEVVLCKQETGSVWTEVVRGDQAGEYIVEPCIVQEVPERTEHLTSDTEAMPQVGTTFNSQQVEECDFESDKSVTFERLSALNNNVTHKIHLGSHQVLLTANLRIDLPPALGIRHDVDVCLWQPQQCEGEDDFSIKHEGTLLAFGYIQASKQNRKFLVTPPDMSYSVICESSGHLFIYKQKKTVSANELRNRTTGRRINTIAEQQVVNVSSDEIIGIYATNKILYLLCESSVKALKL